MYNDLCWHQLNMLHDDYSFHAKNLASAKSFLIYTYGFRQIHTHTHTQCAYDEIHTLISKLLYNNCLYADNLKLTVDG